MANSSVETELARVPLFQGLEGRFLAELATLARPRKYAAGTTIFSQGEPGDGFHILTRGRVKVFRLSAEGKEQILHIWGPGEPFGEVPVFAGGPFPAHALALEDCRTLFLPRAGLLALIRRQPDLALGMLAVLSHRLKQFAAQVEALTLKEVPGRLAAFLLLQADEQGNPGTVELDLAKGQLANLLGATPETFSRVLARMTKDGLIEAKGARSFTIPDRAALVDLAEGRRRLG